MSDVVVTLTGNTGREAERRSTPNSGDVVSVSVAVQTARDKTDWYDLTVWAASNPTLAAELEKIPKGRRVDVVGRLVMRTWTDREGKERVSPSITAYHIRAWPPRADEGTGASPQRREASPQQQQRGAVAYSDDDQIPF